MNYRYFFALTLFGTLSLSTTLMAETQFVSDDLVITLRTGQGNQYEIIKTLSSGTKLEILEQTDTGYTKVKTDSGLEGWVRTQYLTKEPIARVQLESAQKKIESLSEKLSAAQEELKSLRKEKSQLDSTYSKLRSEHE